MHGEKRKFWLFCYNTTSCGAFRHTERVTLQTPCGAERFTNNLIISLWQKQDKNKSFLITKKERLVQLVMLHNTSGDILGRSSLKKEFHALNSKEEVHIQGMFSSIRDILYRKKLITAPLRFGEWNRTSRTSHMMEDLLLLSS